ncbi:MAG: gamma-glutamylcyclotransferase [Alphaproteobacteria bacterium]
MAAMRDDQDLWVFGYGSLMWRPGFDFLEAYPARLYGYHRALCIVSKDHRGTPEQPGLVVGLDHGGSCLGRAYRVAWSNRDAVIAYLDDRELPTAAYMAAERNVHVPGGQIRARCYVVNRHDPTYAGKLSLEEQVRRIRAAAPGKSGINSDYVENLVAHLDDLGITDGPLHEVWELVRG